MKRLILFCTAFTLLLGANSVCAQTDVTNKVTNAFSSTNGWRPATDVKTQETEKTQVKIYIEQMYQWATAIIPFDFELPEEVTAYTCNAVSGNVLQLTKVDNPKANVPYILYAECGCEDTILEGVSVATETSYTYGLLTGVYKNTLAPIGSYVLQSSPDTDVTGFYKNTIDDPVTVGPNHCYLTVPAGAPALYLSVNGTTAINAINALTTGKTEIFDASGARIPALKKGLNIIRTQDGKTQKVMVK